MPEGFLRDGTGEGANGSASEIPCHLGRGVEPDSVSTVTEGG